MDRWKRVCGGENIGGLATTLIKLEVEASKWLAAKYIYINKEWCHEPNESPLVLS